jgi:hypothetical protein
VTDIRKYLEKKRSVKYLEDTFQKNRQTINANIERVKKDAEALGCWREREPDKVEDETRTYWSLLGEKCSNKGLLAKDPHRDSLSLYYIDPYGYGTVQKRTVTITQKGVCIDEILQTIEPLSKKEAILKQLREDFLRRITNCPGYDLITVKNEMKEWATYLSTHAPKTYAICEQINYYGIRQTTILYLNEGCVKELPLMPDNLSQFEGKTGQELEKALCLYASRPNLSFGKNFNTVKKEYHQLNCIIS